MKEHQWDEDCPITTRGTTMRPWLKVKAWNELILSDLEGRGPQSPQVLGTSFENCINYVYYNIAMISEDTCKMFDTMVGIQ